MERSECDEHMCDSRCEECTGVVLVLWQQAWLEGVTRRHVEDRLCTLRFLLSISISRNKVAACSPGSMAVSSTGMSKSHRRRYTVLTYMPCL